MQGTSKGQGKGEELEKEQQITASHRQVAEHGKVPQKSKPHGWVQAGFLVPVQGLPFLGWNGLDLSRVVAEAQQPGPCYMGSVLPSVLQTSLNFSGAKRGLFDTNLLPTRSLSSKCSGSGSTYPEIFLKEDFGGVEGANGINIYHSLEGIEGQGAGWAQKVSCST